MASANPIQNQLLNRTIFIVRDQKRSDCGYLTIETPLPCMFMQGRKEVLQWIEGDFSSVGQAGSHEFDFNAGIQGKSGDSYRTPHMASIFTEYFSYERRGSICDDMLVGKPRGA